MSDKFQLLETDKIHKHKAHRSDDEEEFNQLKSSIKEFGLIEPIIVAPREGNGKFDVIAGNRRFRACSELKLEKVPAIIKSNLDKTEKDILTLVENVQRRGLSDTEKCDGLVALYGSIGFKPIDISVQLNRMKDALNEHEQFVLACEKNGVDKSFLKYSTMTGFGPDQQLNFIKLLDLEPDILESAEESGLTLVKKKMIVSAKLKRKGKDKKVHKNTQKEALRKIKSADNLEDARRKVDQLAQDVRTGAFNPDSGEYFDNLRDKINPHLEGNMTFLVTSVCNDVRGIVEHITGLGDHTEDILENEDKEDEIRQTKPHMIEISKQVTDRQIAQLQSHLIPLKTTVDIFINVLYDELETRSNKKEMLSE